MRINRELAENLAPICTDEAIRSQVFNYESSEFAVVSLGYNDGLRKEDPALKRVREMGHELRYNIYNEHNYLNEETGKVRRGAGRAFREYDQDDERSSFFVTLQRQKLGFAAVGCMRIIEWREGLKLPVEKYFPEAFSQPAREGSVEISRLISVINDKDQQAQSIAMMFGMGISYGINYIPNHSDVYGVVSEDLQKALPHFGAKVEAIAPPAVVPYGTEDQPIKIDLDDLKAKIGLGVLKSIQSAPGRSLLWGRYSEES